MDLTVIDFFCGAGGFSEGFRQQGFKIILGIDNWKPAIDTFNHNFDLNCKVQDILDFSSSIEKIEALPNSSVIIGSPPCVSFSSSNKSGKADKSMGVALTETFLKIVAVKKHMAGSILKAWYMENVVKSTGHLQPQYTFKELSLENWAKQNNKDPDQIAITLYENNTIINSAEYGSPQTRRRVISGEVVDIDKLLIPDRAYCSPEETINLPKFRTLKYIKENLPKPNCAYSNEQITDPLYPHISIGQSQLSDHFYDSGLYLSEWTNSKFLKNNHPYMGVMSFPENEEKPSRTITATKIGTSRESLIYRSEYPRTGNGEFRTPTVREAATLMGFPITYQFIGSEGAKWRLAGNAVCPSVSRSFASVLRCFLGLPLIIVPIVQKEPLLQNVPNLNSFKEKIFDQPPKRISGSRFRRHPFKDGNITVTLSNYDIVNKDTSREKWITSVQYGNGEGFPSTSFKDGYFMKLEKVISEFDSGSKFLEIINNGFSEKIASSELLQKMYEEQSNKDNFLEPTALVEKVASIIRELNLGNEVFIQDEVTIFPNKQSIPQKQVMALYAINKICTTANLS